MAEVKGEQINYGRTGKVTLGVTTLAIAAGAVAIGKVLSDKKNRKALQKQVRRAVEAVEQGRERVQVFQHRIGRIRKAVSKAINKPDKPSALEKAQH